MVKGWFDSTLRTIFKTKDMIRKFEVVKGYSDVEKGEVVESMNLVEQSKMTRKGLWKIHKADPELKKRKKKVIKNAPKNK